MNRKMGEKVVKQEDFRREEDKKELVGLCSYSLNLSDEEFKIMRKKLLSTDRSLLTNCEKIIEKLQQIRDLQQT